MPLVAMGNDPIPSTLRGGVWTLGNFDGVHRGHRALINLAVVRARELGCPAGVLTFDPAPRDIVRPDHRVPRIQSLRARLDALGACGVDTLVVIPFDAIRAAQRAEDFALEVLGERLGAQEIAVGPDFRFGSKRTGTPATLHRVLGVPVHTAQAAGDASGPWSSSRIRLALAEGDVAAAALALGRHHTVAGQVVTGDARGRTLGFPTANLVGEGDLLPADGVYAVDVEGCGPERRGVANLGVRPTFAGREHRFEIHVLDFEGDLVGRRLSIRFLARLRGEMRFDGPDALRAQIARDVAAARLL